MTVGESRAADGFEHADVDTVVVFVDMAGFTAFTEAHGDHRAAVLADRFATIAEEVLGPGDDMIKTIGDAVLITSSDPTAALAFLRRIHEETRRIDGFPLLRAGIYAGSVVKRRGDVFGSTVNTAARLAAIARPGQILGNAEAAAALSRGGPSSGDAVGPAAVAERGCARGSVRPRRRNPPPGARRSDMSDACHDGRRVADDRASGRHLSFLLLLDGLLEPVRRARGRCRHVVGRRGPDHSVVRRRGRGALRHAGALASRLHRRIDVNLINLLIERGR